MPFASDVDVVRATYGEVGTQLADGVRDVAEGERVASDGDSFGCASLGYARNRQDRPFGCASLGYARDRQDRLVEGLLFVRLSRYEYN